MSVENLWKKRHSESYIKKNLPVLRKRKLFEHSSPVPSKIAEISKQKLDESVSICSEIISAESESVAETSLSQQAAVEDSECDKTVDSDKFDDTSKLSERDVESIDEKFVTAMEIEETLNELNVSENSNLSAEVKCQDFDSVSSFIVEKTMFCSNISEASNEGSIFYSQITNFTDTEKGDNTLDSIEANISIREDEQHIDSVAAFHDIDTEEVTNDVIEEVTNDIIIEINQEETETVEIITVEDSGDDVNAVSDAESVDKKEKIAEVKEEDQQQESMIKDEEEQESMNKDEEEQQESMNKDDKEDEPPRRITRRSARKNRPSPEYVRRRNRRNAAKAQREKKAKNARKELEDFDYATFDYAYFSELSEEEKYEYLAMQHLLLSDETEGKFFRESFKLKFVQYCDMILYRANCLSKAKEVSFLFSLL